MNKGVKWILAAVATCSLSASAFDIKDLLKGNGDSNSSASDIVSGIVGAVTATAVEYKDLPGTWHYDKPAVAFKGSDALKNAGGIAASGAIVNKLKPYYTKAGLDKLTIEFGEDSTFVATSGKITLKGDVQSMGDGQFKFNIKALGKIPSGSINAFAEKQGSNICLTFDAKKLIKLAETIASLSGNATLKKASELLDSYDGINIGMSLKK